MPAPIVLRNLTPEVKKVANPPQGAPVISTKAELRDGTRPAAPPAGLIFADSFDAQPTWTGANTLGSAGVTGWNFKRNGEVMFAAHDAIEISGAIPEALRGGTGKSLISWWESYTYVDPAGGGSTGPANSFYSDGQLDYYFGPGNGKTELFVRFYLKFQPGWAESKFGKIFRAMSWDEGDPDRFYAFFNNGDSAPIFLWSYSGGGQYGIRNFLAFRGDPQETNYFLDGSDIPNTPRNINSGDLSLNFDQDIRDLNGDGIEDNPVTMIDKTTGQTLQPGTITHAQVYGDTWNKIEFHIKMNSAPGVNDGIAKQWINDQLCFSNESVAWMAADSPGNKKWNVIGFGGNGTFGAYPNEQEVEEWMAFDDIEIYDSLPEGM